MKDFQLKLSSQGSACLICSTTLGKQNLALEIKNGWICSNCSGEISNLSSFSMKDLYSEIKKPWLVKSGHKLTGPFTHLEVEQSIRAHEIVSLDEISRAFCRWHYLREEPGFAQALEDAHLARSNEDTMTAAIDLKSGEEIIILGGTRDSPLATEVPTIPAKHFVLPHSSPKPRWPTMVIISLIILTVFSALGFSFLFTRLNDFSSGYGFSDLLKRSQRLQNLGDFSAAAQVLHEAQTIRPLDSQVNLQLAQFKVLLERQTVSAKRLLKKLLETETSTFFTREAYVTMGLASLIDKDLDAASNFLSRALSADPTFLPATINLGAVMLLSAQYDKSAQLFEHAYNSGSADGAEVLMAAEALIYLWTSSEDPQYLDRAVKVIDRFLVDAYDYRQEALFVKAYLQFIKTGQVADSALTDLLDLDPELTDHHVHDFRIFRDRIQWSSFYVWCQEMVQRMQNVLFQSTLSGFCKFKNKELSEGEKEFDEIVLKASNSALIQSLYFYLKVKKGQQDEAFLALSNFSGDDTSRLRHILLGRLCESRNDFDCAREEWKRLLEIDPGAIEAISGFANLEWSNKRIPEASRWVENGLKLSSKYIPLLRLKDMILLSGRSQ